MLSYGQLSYIGSSNMSMNTPQFIGLTEMPRGNRILVRVDHIIYACKTQHEDKKDTYVRFATPIKGDHDSNHFGSWFFVKETVEEIERLLGCAPPVMIVPDDFKVIG